MRVHFQERAPSCTTTSSLGQVHSDKFYYLRPAHKGKFRAPRSTTTNSQGQVHSAKFYYDQFRRPSSKRKVLLRPAHKAKLRNRRKPASMVNAARIPRASGIDLGTTNTWVGVWQHGSVEIIANDQGNRTTPSFVAFTDTGRLTRDAAKNQGAMNTVTNTVFNAKRLIGRRFSDASVQADANYGRSMSSKGLDTSP